MGNEFTYSLKLRAEHVGPNQKLRLATLLLFSQEMCIHHTELLGAGRDKTLDKGLLWVIDKQVYEVTRLPVYDEEITMVTYPGRFLHFFFPRYFVMLDKNQNVIIKGTSLWSLMDEKTRHVVDPKEHGIEIDGAERGDEISPMFGSKGPTLTKKAFLHANYSRCGLNGHLNNSSYVDFCQDLLDEGYLLTHDIKRMEFTFRKEIPLGKEVATEYDSFGDDHYFSAEEFFIHLRY